jgi:hypothetical protein
MNNTNGFSSTTPSEYLHNLNAPANGAWTSNGIAAVGQVRLGSNYQYYYPGSNWGVSPQTLTTATEFNGSALTNPNNYGQEGITPTDINNDATDYLTILNASKSADDKEYFRFNSNKNPQPATTGKTVGLIDCTAEALTGVPRSIEESSGEGNGSNADGSYTFVEQATFVPDVRLWLSRLPSSSFCFSRSIEYDQLNPVATGEDGKLWLYIVANDQYGIDRSSVLNSVTAQDEFAMMADTQRAVKYTFGFDINNGRNKKYFYIKVSAYETVIDESNGGWSTENKLIYDQSTEVIDEETLEVTSPATSFTKILKVYAIPVVRSSHIDTFGTHGSSYFTNAGNFREPTQSWLKSGMEYAPRVVAVPKATVGELVDELSTETLLDVLDGEWPIIVAKENKVIIKFDEDYMNDFSFASKLSEVLAVPQGDPSNIMANDADGIDITNAARVYSDKIVVGYTDRDLTNRNTPENEKYNGVVNANTDVMNEVGDYKMIKGFKITGTEAATSNELVGNATADGDDNADGLYELVAYRTNVNTDWKSTLSSVKNPTPLDFGPLVMQVYRRTFDKHQNALPASYDVAFDDEVYLYQMVNGEWILTHKAVPDGGDDYGNYHKDALYSITAADPTHAVGDSQNIKAGTSWIGNTARRNSTPTNNTSNIVILSTVETIDVGATPSETLTWQAGDDLTSENRGVGLITNGDVEIEGIVRAEFAVVGGLLKIGNLPFEEDATDTTVQYINMKSIENDDSDQASHEFKDESDENNSLFSMHSSGKIRMPKDAIAEESEGVLRTFGDYDDNEVVPARVIAAVVADGVTGDSAYDVWVDLQIEEAAAEEPPVILTEADFEEADFIEAIKGDQGDQGDDGTSITWHADKEDAGHPADGDVFNNYAYYNVIDKQSWIRVDNGVDTATWETVALDGTAGLIWHANKTTTGHPTTTSLIKNYAYYNEADHASFVWNGTIWATISEDGRSAMDIARENYGDGEPAFDVEYPTEEDWLESLIGPTGLRGLRGPDGPGGKDAFEVWQKEQQDASPEDPKPELETFTYEMWLVAIRGPEGPAGPDGRSVFWIGTFADHPTERPTADVNTGTVLQLGDAYHNNGGVDNVVSSGNDNIFDGYAYIYDGAINGWKVFVAAGEDGGIGPIGLDGDDAFEVWQKEQLEAAVIAGEDPLPTLESFTYELWIEAIRGPEGQQGPAGSIIDPEYIDFATTVDPLHEKFNHKEGRLYYDKTTHTMTYYSDQDGPKNQLGQEVWKRVKNINVGGEGIKNGQVVYVSGESVDSFGHKISTVELAIANDKTKCTGTIGFATHDIPQFSDAVGAEVEGEGWVTIIGQVSDLLIPGDTAPAGTNLHLSDSIAGSYQEKSPASPSFHIKLGNVAFASTETSSGVWDNTGAIDAQIEVDNNQHDLIKYHNGSFLGKRLLTVAATAEDGVVNATLTHPESDIGDNVGVHLPVHVIIDGDIVAIDTDPINLPVTALTHGTDAAPLRYLLYMESAAIIAGTPTIIAAGDWPEAEHVRLGDVIVQDVADVFNNGVCKQTEWIDHFTANEGVSPASGQGHGTDLNFWIRKQHMSYESGLATTVSTNGSSELVIENAIGTALGLHMQTFPANAAGAPVRLYNYPSGVEGETSGTENVISTGKITSDFYSNSLGVHTEFSNSKTAAFVLWAVLNETVDDSKWFVNIPSGEYANADDARADIEKYTNYSIPPEYKGSAILALRVVASFNGTNWTYSGYVTSDDLRGQIPGTTVGGGGTAANAPALLDVLSQGNTANDLHKIIGVKDGATGTQDVATMNNLATEITAAITTHDVDAEHFLKSDIAATDVSFVNTEAGLQTDAPAEVENVQEAIDALDVLVDANTSNITTLTNAGYIPVAEKGVADGVATLDSAGHVPLGQLSSEVKGGINIVGTWSPLSNVTSFENGPLLTELNYVADLDAIIDQSDDGFGTGWQVNNGDAFVVAAASTTEWYGTSTWDIGDLIVHYQSGPSGHNWFKIDNTDNVLSVNGITPVTGNNILVEAQHINYSNTDSGLLHITSSNAVTNVKDAIDAVNKLTETNATNISSNTSTINGFTENVEHTDGDVNQGTETGQENVLFIENGAVTNTKLATVANLTFKGNVSGSTGAVTDVPLATIKTELGFSYVVSTYPELKAAMDASTAGGDSSIFVTETFSITGTYTPTSAGTYNIFGSPLTIANGALIGLSDTDTIKFHNDIIINGNTTLNASSGIVNFRNILDGDTSGALTITTSGSSEYERSDISVTSSTEGFWDNTNRTTPVASVSKVTFEFQGVPLAGDNNFANMDATPIAWDNNGITTFGDFDLILNHDLNDEFPIVQVYIQDNDGGDNNGAAGHWDMYMPNNVSVIDANNINIDFAMDQDGKKFRVVVV